MQRHHRLERAQRTTPTTRPVALVAAVGGDPQPWSDRWDALDAAVQEARQVREGAKPPVIRTSADRSVVCQVDGCPKVARGRWCSTHRRHFHLSGDSTAGRFSSRTHPALCSIEGCEQPYSSPGLRRPHYRRHKAAEAVAEADRSRPRSAGWPNLTQVSG